MASQLLDIKNYIPKSKTGLNGKIKALVTEDGSLMTYAQQHLSILTYYYVALGYEGSGLLTDAFLQLNKGLHFLKRHRIEQWEEKFTRRILSIRGRLKVIVLNH
jgi:hypothetical protein